MTPEQFDEVLAYNSLEPLGTDRLCQIICRVGVALCDAWGAEYNPQVFDPFYDKRVESVEFQSPDAAAAIVRANAETLGA